MRPGPSSAAGDTHCSEQGGVLGDPDPPDVPSSVGLPKEQRGGFGEQPIFQYFAYWDNVLVYPPVTGALHPSAKGRILSADTIALIQSVNQRGLAGFKADDLRMAVPGD